MSDDLLTKSKDLAKCFKALSDSVRLLIIAQLAANDELNVSELVEALEVSQPLISWHLRRLESSHYFAAIRTEEDVERAKPDPELFLATMAALEVSSKEAIALEDSPNGLLAAKRAGMFCLAVPNPITRQLELEGADQRVDSLVDLPLEQLLEKAGEREVA